MQLKDLYQKIQAFDGQQSKELKAKSQCQKGCSRCCYVDLSVFEIEAENIRQWFAQQSSEKKSEIIARWSRPATTKMNFFQQEVSACPFLSEESCTIYEARPLICRTQGLALSFTQEEESFVDVCPLNEEMLDVASEKEVLNLDLVNQILSQMEVVATKNVVRARVELSALRAELESSAG